MHRLQVVLGHLACRPESSSVLQAAPCSAGFPQASASDVVVVHGRRTPIGRSGRGSFKDTTPDELLSAVLTAVLQDVNLRPEQLGDISVGELTCQTRTGSSSPSVPGPFSLQHRLEFTEVAFQRRYLCLPSTVFIGAASSGQHRWITSENVAERFGISRQKQDAFALASQQKAARAQSRGCFRAEIVPVTTTVLDDKGNKKTVTVSQDEGVRPSTTMEGLAKLKPAFKDGGSTTAGNSSQVSDGAAAVLLARRSKAEELGLPILGVLRSYAVVGVPPDIMGIGPAYAIPAALQKAGLTVNDIDVFEINEAFASQALYCVEKLGIPAEKVNPLGGAIALGHPLGCTGARQVITLLNELKRRGKRAYGVVSMCIGTGMGAAAVFEYPGY
ncbi:hypothetical protein ACRRTK_002965 [Alexandromys fortis]